jgi:2-polyprenyl-3-methyl-5-hydroxy-6-metoxy-1,4-benzoquinol methylase
MSEATGSAQTASAGGLSSEVELPRENIYGHLGRLDFFRRHIAPDDRVIEFGCGTGYMITLPMTKSGYNVMGIDTDGASIDYGRRLIEAAGDDPRRLVAGDLADVDGSFDAVIASEVLEHLDDRTLERSLQLIMNKLKPGGRLLVTVPNGYGWFELEAFVWGRLGLGAFLERRGRRESPLARAKRMATGGYVADSHPSTVANSPHVRRFRLGALRRRLEQAGFEILESRGSVLVCGPISDLVLTGFRRLMRLNQWLGRHLPPIASGFYVAARKPPA